MGTPAGMRRVTFHLETGDNVFVYSDVTHMVNAPKPEQFLP